ncbi:ATP synthase F1 subunit delta [Urbifossiella limnaea]|uniref:ATP synthase subunit delta n=1 Tax=Urbifossiella limnaea TaxID=2528023 RepID=A0A517Y2P1_9BACT|nr:ATP synthase F1 subunit delta [Urbifossiella limnaea]QDU24002.1 ATP synthase subunit delta [Urbifossiella limnaea]
MSQYSSYVEEVMSTGYHMSAEDMEKAQHRYEDILLRTESSRVTGRVARTYAEALLTAAEARGEADAVGDQFRSLGKDVFPAMPGLEALLDSPSVSRKRKDAVITQLFDGRATPLFLDFLRLLNRKDRLGILRLIAIAYRSLRDNDANRLRILVETAAPLDADQTAALERALAELTGKTPVLVVRPAPELIGGLVVHVGDKIYDTSVRSKLRAVRTKLLARGSHEIQGRRDRFRN